MPSAFPNPFPAPGRAPTITGMSDAKQEFPETPSGEPIDTDAIAEGDSPEPYDADGVVEPNRSDPAGDDEFDDLTDGGERPFD